MCSLVNTKSLFRPLALLQRTGKKSFHSSISNHNKVKVDYYVDIISPFSYFSVEILDRYKDRWNLEITYKPVSLGGIQKITGGKPPFMNSKQKAKHIPLELKRYSQLVDIPYSWPTNFFEKAKGSIITQRVLTAMVVGAEDPQKIEQAIKNMAFKTHGDMSLRDDQDNLTIDNFTGIVFDSLAKAGCNESTIKQYLEKAQTPEIKNKLIENTQLAVDKGVFGLPTMFVGDSSGSAPSELIFGADKFEYMAYLINQPYYGMDPDKYVKENNL